MSWICVGCSTQHHDSLDTTGFGLCRSCSDMAKERRAKEEAEKIAARERKMAASKAR
jgi:hypothetical protein